MINKKIISMHIISITDVLSFRQEKVDEGKKETARSPYLLTSDGRHQGTPVFSQSSECRNQVQIRESLLNNPTIMIENRIE